MKTKYKIGGGGFSDSATQGYQFIDIEVAPDNPAQSVKYTVWFPESIAEQVREGLLTAMEQGKRDIERDRGGSADHLTPMEIVVED